MNKSFAFVKMHGLGNDFVIIDATQCKFSLSAQLIRKLADRNFGIGCDQILLLTLPAPKCQDIDFRYCVFNADGSKAYQCINGVRCLAKFVYDHGLSAKRNLVFATEVTKNQTYLEDDGSVTVVLAKPVFAVKDVPIVAKRQALRYNVPIANWGEITIGAVSVGNPHAVVLVASDIANYVGTIGPIISSSKFFPQGANVNFIDVINSQEIKLRVYERGSGETLACGSGACAAVVMGRKWGLLESTVLVNMTGGDLLVTWKGMNSNIKIKGEAKQVFTGEMNVKEV